MDKKLEIRGFKIPKVSLDYEKIINGQQRIEIATSISIMIPKDEEDTTCVVVIKAELKNAKQEIVFNATIRGFVEILDSNMNREQKEEAIKIAVVPIIYEELRTFIEKLLESAHVDFINIPPYEELSV